MIQAVRAGVVGANGFLGGELVRLLSSHPHVRLTALVAGKSAGRQLSDVRPALRGLGDGLLETFDADTLAERCDVVFLALPHGESAVAGRELVSRGVRVIDVGSDFRIVDPAAHARWYGRAPAAPELSAEAFYGLPELTGGAPASARIIANPGCFATALALVTAPIAPHLKPGVALTLFGVTGSTGSGNTPQEGTHHPLRVNNFVAYKALRHQHMGELIQLLATRGAVPEIQFVPHSLPAPRGIHLTMVLRQADVAVDIAELYRSTYANKALLDVVDGAAPMAATLLSARTLIGLQRVDDTVVVTAAIDNLLKGGSGQAVQNLNLWYGWDETAGLPLMGAWP